MGLSFRFEIEINIYVDLLDIFGAGVGKLLIFIPFRVGDARRESSIPCLSLFSVFVWVGPYFHICMYAYRFLGRVCLM